MERESLFGSTRWVRVVSARTPAEPPDAADDCPPFGVMEVTGRDADGVIQINRPSADSLSPEKVYVCGPAGIAAGQYGMATQDTPAATAYDASGGDPAHGADLGTAADSWLLLEGNSGFRGQGAGVDGLVLAARLGAVAEPNLGTAAIVTPDGAAVTYNGLDYYPATIDTLDPGAGTWGSGTEVWLIHRTGGTLVSDGSYHYLAVQVDADEEVSTGDSRPVYATTGQGAKAGDTGEPTVWSVSIPTCSGGVLGTASYTITFPPGTVIS